MVGEQVQRGEERLSGPPGVQWLERGCGEVRKMGEAAELCRKGYSAKKGLWLHAHEGVT